MIDLSDRDDLCARRRVYSERSRLQTDRACTCALICLTTLPVWLYIGEKHRVAKKSWPNQRLCSPILLLPSTTSTTTRRCVWACDDRLRRRRRRWWRRKEASVWNQILSWIFPRRRCVVQITVLCLNAACLWMPRFTSFHPHFKASLNRLMLPEDPAAAGHWRFFLPVDMECEDVDYYNRGIPAASLAAMLSLYTLMQRCVWQG